MWKSIRDHRMPDIERLAPKRLQSIVLRPRNIILSSANTELQSWKTGKWGRRGLMHTLLLLLYPYPVNNEIYNGK